MELGPKSAEPHPEAELERSGNGRVALGSAPFALRASRRADAWLRVWLAGQYRRVRFALLVYASSRVLLIAVALINGALRHHSLTSELANWDGGWYRALATDGYKHHALHSQTTLGFFPLYPMAIWALSQPLLLITSKSAVWAAIVAGALIAVVGGFVATVLVQRLATGWWGEAAGRRAAILFCFFPGSVVFLMVYAEGLLLPLAAGCILALQHRRWLLAGILAAFATATEPEAVVLILVCAVSALLEVRRRGWSPTAAWRSLAAPLLAPIGLLSVAGFLWAWTGTPFASWIAQHYGWDERFDPLAVPHLAIRLAHHISFAHFNHPTINLNWPLGLAGALFLVVLLVLMFRIRRTISVEAWAWTLGVSFLSVTSEFVPPNPRLLITALPAVIVLAPYLRGRAFGAVLMVNAVLLAGLSALTFVSVTLRP